MTDTIKVPRELLEYAVHKMGFVWPNTQNFKELQALLQTPAKTAQVTETNDQIAKVMLLHGTPVQEPVAWVVTGFMGKKRTRKAFFTNEAEAVVQQRNWLPSYDRVETHKLYAAPQPMGYDQFREDTENFEQAMTVQLAAQASSISALQAENLSLTVRLENSDAVISSIQKIITRLNKGEPDA